MIVLVLAIFASDTAYFSLEISGVEKNRLQIFWSNSSGGYSEEQSINIPTYSGKNTYLFSVKNILFVDRIRIDLQQSHTPNPPKPIILHSFSYSFPWFFKGKVFSSNLEEIQIIQGIKTSPASEGTGNRISFTHPDPILDFSITIQPLYQHVILPILLALLIHYMITSSLVQGTKNGFKVEVLLPSNEEKCISEIFSHFNENNIHPSLYRVIGDKKNIRVQFLIKTTSILMVKNILSHYMDQKTISQFQIVASRSGEVA